ncbi:MAG: chorismate mutase [Planctomycetota bacterium]
MGSPDHLHDLRARMDELHERLLAVLHERAALAREIGRCKRDHGLATQDPERERAMLHAALRAAPGDGFSPEQLTRILDEVLAASRALVESPDR